MARTRSVALLAGVTLLALGGCLQGAGEPAPTPLEEVPTDLYRRLPLEPGRLEKPVNVVPVSLRVMGYDASASVLVRVASVEASVDGAVLPVTLATGSIDLGRFEHAWRVATLSIPENADAVTLRLRFVEGGRVVTSTTNDPLDARGLPVSFVADAARMRATGKVALDVDVRRSVVRDAGGWVLLPHVSVRY